jgi:hypothetical protein
MIKIFYTLYLVYSQIWLNFLVMIVTFSASPYGWMIAILGNNQNWWEHDTSPNNGWIRDPQTHLVFGPLFLQMPLPCITSCSMKLESEQVSASLQALYPHCKIKIKAPSIILRKTRFQKKNSN